MKQKDDSKDHGGPTINKLKDGEKPLVIKEIPIPLSAKHPESPHSILPKHEFSMLFIAPKGGGKTTLLCNLIKMYAGLFNTILVFSPTVKNDEKWDWVKNQKVLVQNKPLMKFLQELKDRERKQNKVVGDRPGSEIMKGLVDQMKGSHQDDFDGKIPEDCFFHEYDEDTLRDIIQEQQNLVDLLKKEGKTKHLANRILFIFDDMVGSTLFSNARQNVFKKLNTNHRHSSASLLIVSQGYKEIPKTVRINASCIILFEIYSDAEIKKIYEEFPMGMNYKDWLAAYSHCVKEPYGFMFYNMQKDLALRVMKKFDEVLVVQKAEHQMVS